MRLRKTAFLAFVVLVPAGLLAQASAAVAAEPAIVVQVKSLEGLLSDFQYFAEIAERKDFADQLDGLIKALAGPKGLAGTGIDITRPFGAYVVPTEGLVDSPFAVMIPVADEQSLVKALEGFNIKATKDENGVYATELPNVPAPVYIRIADKYAYVTARDRSYIDPANLLAPKQIFSADANTLLAISLRIDRIPDTAKQLGLGQLDLRAADIKDRNTSKDDRPEITRYNHAVIDHGMQLVKSLLNDGRALELRLAIDRKTNDVSARLTLDGKPDSELTKMFGQLGKMTSQFGRLSDSALSAGVCFALPEVVRHPLAAAIDAVFQRNLAEQKDPEKRKIVEITQNAIASTVKAGEVDVAAEVRPGKDGRFDMLAALKVRNGDKIEQAARQIHSAATESERAKIQFDTGKAGPFSLHRLDLTSEFDSEARRLFGENAKILVGIRPDAAVIAIGQHAEALIKDHAAVRPASAALAHMDASVRHLARLDKDHHEAAVKLAESSFGSISGSDRLLIRFEGGSQFKLTLTTKAQVLRFFAELGQLKRAAAGGPRGHVGQVADLP